MKFATVASICIVVAAAVPRSATTTAAAAAAAAADCTALQDEHKTLETQLAAVAVELEVCENTTPPPSDPAPTPGPLTPEPVTPKLTLAPTPAPSYHSDGGFDSSKIITAGQSWNYNLDLPVDTDVKVDAFFIDMDDAQDTIDTLHALGKVVACYISIGTVENWRDDADQFPSRAIGRKVAGRPGEKWVDVNNQDVQDIMRKRVTKAADMGCDAIDPDNMMVYSEKKRKTRVSVTKAEQVEYNRWFAEEVHENEMAVGLKNAVELVASLVDDFDFALNKECHEWNECDTLQPFLDQGKAVFNVEYRLGLSMCNDANAMGLDTIAKDYDLDSRLCSCRDSSRNKDCDSLLL